MKRLLLLNALIIRLLLEEVILVGGKEVIFSLEHINTPLFVPVLETDIVLGIDLLSLLVFAGIY